MKLKILRIILMLILIADSAFIFHNSAEEATASSAASGAVTERIAQLFVPHFREMDEAEQMRTVSLMNSAVRECAHMIQFVPFGASLYWLLCTLQVKKKIKRLFFPITLGCGFLYALSDEIHQLFVPGRAFQWADIGMDTCGVLLGAAAVALLLKIISLCRSKRSPDTDKTA